MLGKIDFYLGALTAKVLKFHRLELLLILSSRLRACLDHEVFHLIDLARCRALLVADGCVSRRYRHNFFEVLHMGQV